MFLRSATVYKALYLGEVVAAKAIDIGRGPAAQEAFISVGGRARLCVRVLTSGAGRRDLAGAPPPCRRRPPACDARRLPALAPPPGPHPTLQEALRLHRLHHPHVPLLTLPALPRCCHRRRRCACTSCTTRTWWRCWGWPSPAAREWCAWAGGACGQRRPGLCRVCRAGRMRRCGRPPAAAGLSAGPPRPRAWTAARRSPRPPRSCSWSTAPAGTCTVSRLAALAAGCPALPCPALPSAPASRAAPTAHPCTPPLVPTPARSPLPRRRPSPRRRAVAGGGGQPRRAPVWLVPARAARGVRHLQGPQLLARQGGGAHGA